MEFTRKKRYLFSVLSGLLLALSFPFTGSIFPFAFIALVPLLVVEHNVYRNKYRSGKVLLHAYITFFLYNLGATYWIYFAQGGEAGAVLAYFLNGFLMALTFFLFHLTKKYIGQKEGYISLLFYWISFEFIHYHWELSWPWLNLGNIFSTVPEIVQWYSYSGVLGGTLWILLINLIGFKIANNIFFNKESFKVQTPLFYLFAIVILVPSLLSWWTYSSYEQKGEPIEVVITQPNVDPYNEKFSGDLEEQLNRFLDLADEKVTDSTVFVLAPETAISRGFYEEGFIDTEIYEFIRERVKNWNGAVLYVGASTRRFFEKHNSRASRPQRGGGYFESYNTSLTIESVNPPTFVHKSKLVLGVEKVPFSHIFPWLEQLSIDNGGTSGTLGVEDSPKILRANGVKFAPSICYESVYGGFISEQARQGAEAIFIITNDGWWDDSPGHRQHNEFARLRAIETRKYVARSANTGISSVINQRGEVEQSTNYWEPAVIRSQILLNDKPTFYTTYGDVIGRSFAFVAALLLVYTLVKYLRRFGKS